MPNHRAEKRAVSWRPSGDPRAAGSSTGHHGSPSDRRTRTSLYRVVRSVPTLVGATAILLAAAGALTAGSPDTALSQLASSSVSKYASHASALSGSSGVASSQVVDRREQAVSRDSQREALKDAADEDLQQAAEEQAKERNAALAALAASAEKQAGLLAKDAWQLPVTPGVYHLTSRFGQCSSLWSHCHTGLDFAAPEGTPIHAVANGTITDEGDAGAYGNRTVMTLKDGTELWYCHQSAYVAKSGQKVTAGQVIGLVGATGNTTGPHVHLEVRPGAGDPVDPQDALVAHGLKP